jgi:hypothetical protein
MTSKRIDEPLRPSKVNNSAPDEVHSSTVYVLMGICYLLIAITLYVAWQKASLG